MDGTRPREPLTDAGLDRELGSALGVEPSPEFLARVRTRIAAEPEASSWRLAGDPLWAVGIIGIVLTLVVPSVMRQDPVGSRANLTRVPPAAGEVRPVPPAVTAIPVHQRPVVRGRTEAMHTLPLQLSPVLFAEGDRLAFASFVTAVGDGRVPEEVVQALGEEDMTPLAIEPLVIDPLPPVARVAQQGESQW